MKTTQVTTIKSFLRLPKTALPSAQYLRDCDEQDLGNAWSQLRAYNGRLIWGAPVLLTADRDGWRNGVTVTV